VERLRRHLQTGARRGVVARPYPSPAVTATAVADRLRAPAPTDTARIARWAIGTLVLLVLVGLSVWERTRVLNGSFWMDEGISVGIASHPFSAIPDVLRNDGSPPLYYFMLHVWMRLFGSTESATHTLSLLFSLATIPVGLWSARTLFGPRAGWICATLCALNPFLTVFGQETRMYSLVALEGLLAAALLAIVFIQRRRGFLAPLVVVLAAMLYTHGWALFYCAAAVLGVLLLVRGSEDRRPLVKDGLIAFGGAGILFLPWLPTLLEQTAHTAAPWSRAPRFGAPVQISRGLLGGDAPAVALLLAGGAGAVGLLRRGRKNEQRQTVTLFLILIVVTLALAWILSQITPAWTSRYFGIVLGPLLLILAGGMAKMRALGLIALLAVCFFWINPQKFTGQPKSDLRDISATVKSQMGPGDVVVNAQPEQTPAAAYYLGNDKLYGSPLSYRTDPDPYLMNWYDAVAAMKAVDPRVAAKRLVASLKPGQKLLLIRPITDGTDNWSATWTSLIRRRAAEMGEIFATDSTLKRVAVAPPFYRNATEVGNSAVLYEKKPS
jgi:mannosyltransferase